MKAEAMERTREKHTSYFDGRRGKALWGRLGGSVGQWESEEVLVSEGVRGCWSVGKGQGINQWGKVMGMFSGRRSKSRLYI